LENVVDVFVLVESAGTFTGAPKPLYYQINADRFARWAGRIRYVQAALPPGDPWTREAAQREAIRQGLAGLVLSDDDVLVLSDVDEIWRATVPVETLPRPFTVLQMAMYVHHFGWQHPDPWDGPVVCRIGDLPPAEMGTFQTLRTVRLHPTPARVPDAGWHLSYFGGPAEVARKMAGFSHTEFADVDMTANEHEGLHVDGTPLIASQPTDLPTVMFHGWWPQ
jgi:beta-1,4-mannosyl-glycoprotein beta-1,4-N-acetylglucosaminyltransferase